MREQIRRILGLVHAGHLSSEDAASLLAALHPRLQLSEDARAPLFALLVAEGFGTEKVADLLLSRVGTPARPPAPKAPPAPNERGGEWPNFDALAARVGQQVSSALGNVSHHVGDSLVGVARSGSVLRLELSGEDGDEYSANLPLSLAPHLNKLIPARAVRLLEHAGLSIEALQLLLESEPPAGPLLSASDEEGNTVRLTVK